MKGQNQPIKLLFVDDQPTVRRGLNLFFNMQGREDQLKVIEEPILGPNLLEEIIRLNPDLLLLDVAFKYQNKACSGIDITRKIRLIKPELKIIFYTAFDFPHYKKAVLQAGADAFVSRKESLYTLYKTMMLFWTKKELG